MNTTISEPRVDVRPMPPRERHATIFATWRGLPDGGAMLLVNDHDPLPLYYQFAAEHAGEFRWEYELTGPEEWRVRIRRGAFTDPGFVPAKGARGSCKPGPVPIAFVKDLVVDVRDVLAGGGSPCDAIEGAVSTLVRGQKLLILAPFEPVPLYTKLGRCGYSHETTRDADGTWRVLFESTGDSDAARFERCGDHHD